MQAKRRPRQNSSWHSPMALKQKNKPERKPKPHTWRIGAVRPSLLHGFNERVIRYNRKGEPIWLLEFERNANA
jgi:hypothetical protein